MVSPGSHSPEAGKASRDGEGSEGSETLSERRLALEGIDRGTESGGLFGDDLLVPGAAGKELLSLSLSRMMMMMMMMMMDASMFP